MEPAAEPWVIWPLFTATAAWIETFPPAEQERMRRDCRALVEQGRIPPGWLLEQQ